MARYIDADKFEKYILERYNTMEMVGINQVVNFIHEQPTADVKEVVRGEWVTEYETEKCSICGFSFRDIFDSDSNFSANFNINTMVSCPKCGADMRGAKANAKTDSI